MENLMLGVNAKLQQDNVYPANEIKSLSQLTGLPSRKGLEQAIISGGQIVNVVSDSYGHIPNETYFKAVEDKLSGLNFMTRSINRDNRSFAVDYILNDPNAIISVKNGVDTIKPMLRFINSYDGSNKTAGYFGYFRQVCSNGLHVSHQNIGFSVKHRGNLAMIVLPEIKSLVNKFMDNEFYSVRRKFEILAETQITDVREFVKLTSDKLKLFKFEASEKNPEPSLNARLVIETMQRESSMLGTPANLWLGYNAFNEVLHGKLKKSFDQQKREDSRLFETVLEMVGI